MSKFGHGNPGRPSGSRNRLQGDVLKALADDFKEHGVDVVRIVRVENPDTYLKIVTSILPKELLVGDMPTDGISDDELKAMLDECLAKRVRANAPA